VGYLRRIADDFAFRDDADCPVLRLLAVVVDDGADDIRGSVGL
jgi:hypothetical protein